MVGVPEPSWYCGHPVPGSGPAVRSITGVTSTWTPLVLPLGSDYPPTDQTLEVPRMSTSQLAAHQEKQNKGVEADLAAVDRLLTEKKIPRILSDFKEK